MPKPRELDMAKLRSLGRFWAVAPILYHKFMTMYLGIALSVSLEQGHKEIAM